MQIGLGLSVPILSVLRKLASALFSPSSLFENSEVGVWYDPSDLDTMYQNSTGTTPVTGLEQPVGLLLDKSKGLTLGSELVTNGGFDSAASWTLSVGGVVSIAGGVLAFSAAGPTQYAFQNILTVGKTYKITYTVSGYSSGSIRCAAGATNGTARSANGTYTEYVTATSNGLLYIITAGGATVTLNVDNVSAQLLPGNHAKATNDGAARPILRSRYNLLTYSEQLDNAAWAKTNATITANATTAPDGTTTADKLVEASDSAVLHSTNIFSAILLSGQYTFSVYAKASERNWLLLNFAVSNGTYSVSDSRAWFDLSNGTVGTVGGTGATASITAAGNGWYRCVLSSGSYASANRKVLAATATADGSSSNDGDGTSGVYIWGAQLVANSVFPSNVYQRIEAAPSGNGTVTYATGSDWPQYLYYDGVDDGMASSSIDFSATDEMSVFAGVTKQSDAAFGALTELSASSGGNNGAFGVLLPQSATAGAQFRSRGTASGDAAVSSGYPAPLSLVLTGLGEVSADTSVLRLNGSQAATSANDQGTGNYGNYPLYIGSRGGIGNYFKGDLYSLIVRGKTSTETEIQSTENYVAGKLGRSITWAYDYLVDDAGNFITTDGGDQIYVAETVTFT